MQSAAAATCCPTSAELSSSEPRGVLCPLLPVLPLLLKPHLHSLLSLQSTPAGCSIQLLYPRNKQTKHPRVMRPPLGIDTVKGALCIDVGLTIIEGKERKGGKMEIWREELWSDGVDWAVCCWWGDERWQDKTPISDSGDETTTFWVIVLRVLLWT